ncbi:TetR/AcrR family transcriptional regulator [Hahella sp. SMD15-11]|uniref:TetR/AcrR family transcriptional regulator n=1 Tax=Thermohahella caldifontis TaxID=3142973 RepID=A0AB39UXH1_9GAMM
MKTRDRILITSLELFNTYGEPNVTTLQIADTLDISPGNLYYHFKNKSEIINELFGQFEKRMIELLDVPPGTTITLEDHWLFLHLLFELIAEYRFIYRDLVNILQRYDRLNTHFRRILNRKLDTTKTLLASLKAQDILQASQEEMEALCHNLVLTITYWSSFDILFKQPGDDVDLARGVYHVVAQVAPYLRDAERQEVEALGRQYL